MATELAKAYVQIVPSAQGIKGKISEELGGEASSAGKSAGTSIASSIKKAIAAAGIGAALKTALEEGGNLQQSIGGIETLFGSRGAKTVEEYAELVGQSVDYVAAEFEMLQEAQANAMNNASIAYKTAGLSANEYMETISGFAASLKQSTASELEAAEIGNQAVIDMADNANKMGTSMEAIQNAYQGFAKQNYTMLDNLKLGYGGTKTEMQRLLADAQKLTGVKYDIDNLSDVYLAIHAIQENLGITGTTAKEAASTLQGSMSSMKAAFTNVLGNLSLGEDIGPSLDALGETVFTFMTGNLVPMVGNILSNLPEVIESGMSMAIQGLNLVANNADVIVQNGIELIGQLIVGITSAIPYLAESGIKIVAGLGSALINTDWIGIATDVLTQLRDNLSLAAEEILGTDGSIVTSMFDGIINQLPTISEGITSVFQFLWDTCNNIWITVGQPIWDAIMSTIDWLATNWNEISSGIEQIFMTLWDACQSVWVNIGQPIWDMISFAVSELWSLFQSHMPAIMAFFQEAIEGIKDTWNNHLKPVFDTIVDVLNNTIKPAFEFVFKTIIEPLITNVFDAIKRLWNGTLKPVFDGICDFLLGVFTNDWKRSLQGILNIVTGIFNAVRVAVEKPMDLVKDIVNSAIDFIKEKFDFDWELPKLKMPHFTISGSFSLNPLSVPSFGIDWYAKAMNNPIIMNSPTAFGINSLGQIMAGGEVGSEVVSGTDTLMRMIAEAVVSQNAGILPVLVKILEAITNLDENMSDNMRDGLSGTSLNINNREFARLVKAVT